MRNTKSYITFILILISSCLFGQKFIKDSVVLHLNRNAYLNNKLFQIYNFNDKRDHPGNVFTISEKKKYGIVPVDYLYVFEDSLEKALNTLFKDTLTDNRQQPKYKVDILYFTPGLRKGGIISQYYLSACLYFENTSPDLVREQNGVLVYETRVPYKTYKNKANLAYENLIYNWQKEVVVDFNAYAVTPEQARDFLIPNLKPSDYKYYKSLILKSSYLVGIDWFGVDGEVFFSTPETGKPFIRNTGTVRYVNADNYESLLFGRSNENFYWRFNNKALFELQNKILVGINRWKDIETVDHGLEEILQLCLSFSESVQFNRLDKRGLVLSLGLIQDVFYIYNRLDYRLGLKASLGFKL